MSKGLAVITGASSGIAYELAWWRRRMATTWFLLRTARSPRRVAPEWISVTLLMPTATATGIFERGHYETTKLATGPLADAGEVARDGWNPLLAGDAEVISAEHARTKAAEMKTKIPEQLAREHAAIARPSSVNFGTSG